MPAFPGRGATAGPRTLAGTALAARLGAVAIWCLVACGPLALLTVLASHPTSGSRSPAGPQQSEPAADPGGFAQLYVTAYLRNGGNGLTTYYPAAPDLTGTGTAAKRPVTETTVIDVLTVSPGYWSVTVAADEETSGLHYFEVPIAGNASSGQYAATALPAEVAAPSTAAEPGLGYDTTNPVAQSPLTTAVAQFLAAYLTGKGNLSRYLTPGTAINAVTPAPYEAIGTVTVYDTQPGTTTGNRTRVLAQVQAADSGGQQWPFAYALTLTQLAGQWDVAAIDPAPALQQLGTKGH